MDYNWSAGWRSAITAGVVVGILAAVPLLGTLCCLWTLGGGAMAIVLYRRNSGQPVVPVSIGFRTGVLTGLVGFAVDSLAQIFKLISNGGAAQRAAFKEAIDKSIARGSQDPQAVALMQRFAEWIQSPQGFAIMFTFSLLMLGIGFILFTGIGGVLGASLFGKPDSRR